MKIIFGGKSKEVTLTAQKSEEIPLKNVRPTGYQESQVKLHLEEVLKRGFRLDEGYNK